MEETRSGSRSLENSTSEKGSLSAQSGLPVSSFPDNISTEGAHANNGDSPERGHSMDSHLQNVMSLPSDSEEKDPETVPVKTVSRFHGISFRKKKKNWCGGGGGV